MSPKPRNLQWHTYPKNPVPQAQMAPKSGTKILGQADTIITNLKGKGKGKVLVVCGNGASIATAPLDKLKGQPGVEFMAINIPDTRVWPTEYWLLLDSVTMRRRECAPFVPDYQGIVITNHIIKKDWRFRHLVRTLVMRGEGISRDMLSGLNMGGSSGYVALQIALYLGYKDIYFFGLDMAKTEEGELYSYGENSAMDAEKRVKMFEADARYWGIGAEQLTPEERAHIHICSDINPWSFVKEFDRLTPALGVEKILGPEKPEEKPIEPDKANPSL